MAETKLSIEYSSSDDEMGASSPVASANPSSSTTAATASSSFANSPFPTGSFFSTTPTNDHDDEHFDVAELMDQIEEMTCDESDDSLAVWGGREILSPIPKEDETESPALHNLPHESHESHGVLSGPAAADELLVGAQDGSGTDCAPAAAVPWDDMDLEDLPSVPSTIEDVVPIEPFGEDQIVSPQRPNHANVEPLDERNLVPLYHEDDRMVDSIFELVPPDPVDRPYSWMIENPGEAPEAVQTPDEKDWYNIDGEKEVERTIRSFINIPEEYFLITTSLKCLVRLRHRKFITEQACAGLLYRCVDGNARLWGPIKKAFISRDFDTIPYPRKAINLAVESLYDSVREVKTMKFNKTLTRLIQALLTNRSADCYLVYAESRKMVPNELRQQGCFDISEEFMGRYGTTWPFDNVSPEKADVLCLGEPLKFEEVFGNAEYLARERAIRENKQALRRGKKKIKWEFPVEDADLFVNEVFDQLGILTDVR